MTSSTFAPSRRRIRHWEACTCDCWQACDIPEKYERVIYSHFQNLTTIAVYFENTGCKKFKRMTWYQLYLNSHRRFNDSFRLVGPANSDSVEGLLDGTVDGVVQGLEVVTRLTRDPLLGRDDNTNSGLGCAGCFQVLDELVEVFEFVPGRVEFRSLRDVVGRRVTAHAVYLRHLWNEEEKC